MPSLPTLAFLRTFEAVVRHRSFSLAAQEMNLTNSAVSHQIAKLESTVGVTLLERTRLGAHVTSAGALYLQRVSPALRTLENATRDLLKAQSRSLYVHTSPSFASLWLMPRLSAFAKAHPDISLHLSASPSHSIFAAGEADLDIRYGLPNWPELTVRLLFHEPVAPLCSPALARSLRIRAASGLLTAPLIQSTVSIVQWQDWFKTHALEIRPEGYSLRFDRAQLSLDAAAQGLGVALESLVLAESYIADQRLVTVLPVKYAVKSKGHYAVYPAHQAQKPEVAAFLAWLQAEAKQRKTTALGKYL